MKSPKLVTQQNVMNIDQLAKFHMHPRSRCVSMSQYLIRRRIAPLIEKCLSKNQVGFREGNGTKVDDTYLYFTKTLILYIYMYVCIYVPEIQPKRYTIVQKF